MSVDIKNKQTEQRSLYSDLDKMSTSELLSGINAEDRKVPEVVATCIPQISRFTRTAYGSIPTLPACTLSGTCRKTSS